MSYKSEIIFLQVISYQNLLCYFKQKIIKNGFVNSVVFTFIYLLINLIPLITDL